MGFLHDALHSGFRDVGVTLGKTHDHLVDDRLFTQLDHTQSLAAVHLTVNWGRRRQMTADDTLDGGAIFAAPSIQGRLFGYVQSDAIYREIVLCW